MATPPNADASFLCWRPEDADFAATEGENVVTADVSERAYQGSYTDLHLSVPGASDQRLHWPGVASGIGERATFRLPADRIRFVRGELE